MTQSVASLIESLNDPSIPRDLPVVVCVYDDLNAATLATGDLIETDARLAEDTTSGMPVVLLGFHVDTVVANNIAPIRTELVPIRWYADAQRGLELDAQADAESAPHTLADYAARIMAGEDVALPDPEATS